MDEQQPKKDSTKEIQSSVEKLLGAKTDLKIKKLSKLDKERESFEKIIATLEVLDTRSFFLHEQAGINLSNYNDLFFDVIDNLIVSNFGEEGAQVIHFYLYERINADGSKNVLYDDKEKKVPLENTSDLWNVIQSLKKEKTKVTRKKPK